MDTSKIIKGIVNARGYTVTKAITQWDYGYVFVPEFEDMPATYRLDFSNDEHHGTALPVYCGSEGGEVPEELIDTGKDIYVWFYYIGDGYGKSTYEWRIPNHCKPKTEEDEPTPSQQSSIDQAIARSNEAVEQAEQSASDASQSAQSAQGYAEQAESARDTAQGYASNAQLSATQANNSAISANQSASASAQSASEAEAARQGTTDLVAEAQRYADASEQSATASANSAEQAHQFAQTASLEAESAQDYATQADISANTASTKASEASQSATTASDKATESAQSASQALTYKTDAETAKTASQTAQGLAESARDTAVQAKTDAESARDEAQSLVDGISGKVEQIDANTERIESLEDDRYKPYVTDSASGAIASFPDGADDLPMKSLVVDINPIQDLSNGDPSPTNICPISGWTQVGVEQRGKNLIDADTYYGTYKQSDGSYIDQGAHITLIKIPIPAQLVGKEVTFSAKLKIPSGSIVTNLRARAIVNGAIVQGTFVNSADYNLSSVTVTPLSANDTLSITYGSGGAQNMQFKDVQLELGSTATAYEPYTGRSITIDLGQTVYGGHIDVISGVLTVDMAKVHYLWGEGVWTTDLGNNIRKLFTFSGVDDSANKRSKQKCNVAPYLYNYTQDSTHFYAVSTGAYLYLPESTSDDTQIEIVYPLATPIEIQLTPQQVNSLLGVNNIWADTGDCAVEYRADTRLYIEKLTQPEEDDMIANSAIASGQFFMIGNTLYRALANIASGATITVGTNAQRVSLSDALNLVNA